MDQASSKKRIVPALPENGCVPAPREALCEVDGPGCSQRKAIPVGRIKGHKRSGNVQDAMDCLGETFQRYFRRGMKCAGSREAAVQDAMDQLLKRDVPALLPSGGMCGSPKRTTLIKLRLR
ncbi:hypothetical protein AVEN_182245-1 [Araneus ventricosus]|uniref:Uncharacterized protein n=1 Tax=Araneus ventricosus TaxID=182803 RepID=A0A4Y2UCP0_ARAVE|nr:hypothetical protein AVEN_182245-1 [Araneus ventricosus]